MILFFKLQYLAIFHAMTMDCRVRSFDIGKINKELTKNSKVIEGIKDYISHKCDATADTEHSVTAGTILILTP